MKTARTSFSAAFALVALAGAAFAGPLNPPAGPVTSTMKTLSDVEPRVAINSTNTPGQAGSIYRITSPGSYYLTSNIVGQPGKACIEIAMSNVTIDLNGFTLQGSGATLEAIRTAGAAFNNITIRNGTINGFAQEAIDLTFNGLDTGTGSIIEGVHASNNTGAGIRSNHNAVIRNCTATGNSGYGIVVGNGSSIESCGVRLNTLYGILAGETATISRCNAVNNTQHGISAMGGSTITDCVASQNGTAGINAGDGSTIARCSSYTNDAYGITASTGCTIESCTVKNNTLDGIRVFYFCTIRNNTCHINGAGGGDGASIYALGNDNRIEGNHCNDSDRGIQCGQSGNFVVRNTCSNNGTNWVIVAGNFVAPIVIANSSAAINGNVGGGSLGSTDPNANFTY